MWVKVWKKERLLVLMDGSAVVKRYPVALGFNPRDDKVRQGDGCTPEGRFYICEMLEDPVPKKRYGARSMRVSYPTIEDARRGLRDGLIKRASYLSVVRAINEGRMPPQNTVLGGSIRIHGGGVGGDWTLGCIAMRDKDIREVFDQLPANNALVEIYHSKRQDSVLNSDSYTRSRILEGAKRLYADGCRYTSKATTIMPISFPYGDFRRDMGVCTDVVIRALRHCGIDLQSLLYEDIMLHPQRYPAIPKPNPHIDHRRTRNLKTWLDHHARTLTNAPPGKAGAQWQPGDIVLMNTGVANGTVYDHIGIVGDSIAAGRPLVINLWTIGYELAAMDLLDGEYPAIVGHYRISHPFDYAADAEVLRSAGLNGRAARRNP